MKEKTKKYICLLFSGVITILFGLVTFNQLKVGDFQHHLVWARELNNSGYIYLRANILFQRLVLVIRDLLPFNFLARISVYFKQIIDIKSYDISALILMILTYLATFYLVSSFFNQNITINNAKKKYLIISLFTLLIMLVGPIFLFTFPARQYLGYITGNPYHNPTYLLMRPFAVSFFIFSIKYLYKQTNWKMIFLCAFILFCASLAKPNFTLSFVPTLFITVLLRFKERKEINFRFLGFSVFFPCLIVLISQYIIMYTGERGDKILFAPFLAILTATPNILSVLFFSFMSLLFPLTTTILYWKKYRNELPLQLVWINFIISLLIAYLFTEQVEMNSLNFWWTPMVGIFLLFMVTFLYYIKEVLQKKQSNNKLSIKEITLSFLIFLHLSCGVIFYISSVTATSLVK